MIVSDKTETKYTPVDAGMHIARCYMIAELGIQKSNNPSYNDAPKLMIGWELIDSTIEIDGEELPRVMSREFTSSIGPKANLRKVLASWRGRDFTAAELESFDLDTIVGAPCYLNVVHKTSGDKTYANIESVVPLPAGIDCPKGQLPAVTYDLADGDPPETIPAWIRDKIAKRVIDEPAPTPPSAPVQKDDDTDLPF